MEGYPQYRVPVRIDDGTTIQIFISRYTISGITSMYGMTRSDTLECSSDITWLRRAIFRLRDHMQHMANDTVHPIPYPILHERENALLGLVFVPE